jgi:hypothetical protein
MNKDIYMGIGIVAAVVAWTQRDNIKNILGSESVFNAHVDPAADAQVARNFGTVNLVSTERNIMAGQAVGQTLNYSGMGLSPEAVGATNGLGQIFDLSAYAATMRSTDPVWGQNYPGRAIGQD